MDGDKGIEYKFVKEERLEDGRVVLTKYNLFNLVPAGEPYSPGCRVWKFVKSFDKEEVLALKELFSNYKI